ncbi:MAG TPA: LptF/LptG family permease [Gemmatimonadaceae bacterium]|nr:LptF/LptG family permease [Gemmatimonadaceae bacterium]
MIGRLLRPLDRYVFGEWWRIFVVTALGFPLLVVVIDLTDNLDKLLNRHLTQKNIILSYVYMLPESMFMVLPAAVLFATVFAIGGLTRHSEVTAAKASGISFYRLIAPIFFGATLATGMGLALTAVLPITNAERSKLLEEKKFQSSGERYNFAYSAENGRVYKISALSVERATVDGIDIERKGRFHSATDTSWYPTYVLSSVGGKWSATDGWKLGRGELHVTPDSTTDIAFAFDSVVDNRLRERPRDFTVAPKLPDDMGWKELGQFIAAMERSGADVKVLRVVRMLKVAIPFTCLVILLFGAPLATSTQRGGAAYGVGVSLGTTIVFLMLIQLMKAVGGSGLIPPDLAAWVPSIIFGVTGMIMLMRVRT